jgi:hypothetical protein
VGDGRGHPQVLRRVDLVGRIIAQQRRNHVGDHHDRAHPAGGRAAPGDLRQDFGDDVLVRLVAPDIGGHREPEDPGVGQLTKVVGMHPTKPFGFGRSRTQPVDQRIDLCEHIFGCVHGV